MLIPNQTSVKIHFAVCETPDNFVCVKAAGSHYGLLTAFPFICPAIGLKPLLINNMLPVMDIPSWINRNVRHSIMDSGLFTLMFGGQAGKKDAAFVEKWLWLLINFIKESKFAGSCVEVDCQKILSPEYAWKFRQTMREELPENRIINVFHLEDGQTGLDRMIDFTDYIAISVPEMRFANKKDQVVRIANYIKNRQPTIDIHLLGCTEYKLLRELKFCASADSSSWLGCVRYGHLKTIKGNLHLNNFYRSGDLQKQYADKFFATAETYGATRPYAPHEHLRLSALTFACESTRFLMEKKVGNQQ